MLMLTHQQLESKCLSVQNSIVFMLEYDISIRTKMLILVGKRMCKGIINWVMLNINL